MQIAIEKKQLLATGSHEKSEPLKKIMKRNRRVTDRPIKTDTLEKHAATLTKALYK